MYKPLAKERNRDRYLKALHQLLSHQSMSGGKNPLARCLAPNWNNP